ncbi:MAG: asparagine synthase (glutamine-hydrolyzing) [Gammaproteobacteria bacterium]|nr:asparagine synthase (glutamine-hydrolyzing) [Gammaproteobacteria bacterium]
MCGIALFFQANGKPADQKCIARMTRALTHRGPDDESTQLRGPAALGHTRLSIVDIAQGAQPMQSEDGRYAIVFNGEIYNFRELRSAMEHSGIRFQNKSDTEVILQLYIHEGPTFVAKLRGMFSFIIHDTESQTVFLARDRLGIKPLFYHWNGAELIAASEIKAIFASGRVEPRLNPVSIRNYFNYQFAISPHTPFLDIVELPPGHHLTLKSGAGPQLQQYWDIRFPREHEYETLDETYWTNAFESALNESAACHTIGEVPIGAYLSGGIDSSTTTWLLTEHYDKPVQTFSIRFDDENLDESPIYHRIADHLGVENQQITLSSQNGQCYLQELESAVYHLEQPQRMGLDIPYYLLSDLVQQRGYKVVYTGDGSDEILAGYDCYRQDYMRLWGNDIQDQSLRRLLYDTQFTMNFSASQVHLLYNLHDRSHQQKVVDRFGCYPAWYDFWQITTDQLPGLFNPEFEKSANAEDQMALAAEAMKPHLEGRHRVNQSLYIETKTRLPGWILWKTDRMSMAHGVEARVPFLDHPLVELAARIPPQLKLNGMNEKYILKKIAMPHLPQHPWNFKKKAFYTPIREWFFEPEMDEMLDPYLSADAVEDAGIFNPQQVESLRTRILEASFATDMESYYHLMKLEWIMTLVLTVQMLHVQFVAKKGACFNV